MSINKVGPEPGDFDYNSGPSFGEQQKAIDDAVAEANRWWAERWQKIHALPRDLGFNNVEDYNALLVKCGEEMDTRAKETLRLDALRELSEETERLEAEAKQILEGK